MDTLRNLASRLQVNKIVKSSTVNDLEKNSSVVSIKGLGEVLVRKNCLYLCREANFIIDFNNLKIIKKTANESLQTLCKFIKKESPKNRNQLSHIVSSKRNHMFSCNK